MSDEINILHQAWTGSLTVVAALFGFVGKRIVDKVDETAEALVRHEKEDVGKYATVEQLSHLYDRTESGFRDLRTDLSEIKNILINRAHL